MYVTVSNKCFWRQISIDTVRSQKFSKPDISKIRRTRFDGALKLKSLSKIPEKKNMLTKILLPKIFPSDEY